LREDVGTTNGTFVNGQKLKTGEPVALRAGDKIRFGSVDIDVVA
jgi:pSer/pThr/pTyr-binding forkhead associated (FHA) protein